MKKTGLYFGSFNPIHIGHLVIAEYFATQTDLEEVWFVVSPQNPFKQTSELAPENDRIEMVRVAIENNPKLKACDIEFTLPRPSYTHETLKQLILKFPDRQFFILLGEDNKTNFEGWKNYLWILENFHVRFFPRHQITNAVSSINWGDYNVKTIAAPKMEISSTQIRKNFKTGMSNRYLLSEAVIRYIREHHLYEY